MFAKKFAGCAILPPSGLNGNQAAHTNLSPCIHYKAVVNLHALDMIMATVIILRVHKVMSITK